MTNWKSQQEGTYLPPSFPIIFMFESLSFDRPKFLALHGKQKIRVYVRSACPTLAPEYGVWGGYNLRENLCGVSLTPSSHVWWT